LEDNLELDKVIMDRVDNQQEEVSILVEVGMVVIHSQQEEVECTMDLDFHMEVVVVAF
jgi:hypothetical protein